MTSAQSIPPLTKEQQQQVIDKTNIYIQRALDTYDIKSKPLEIKFDLKGRNAGMYRVCSYGKFYQRKLKREVRYNPYIFSKYFEDNIKNTVPHEVAHYISDLIYGLKNIKPHGNEWKQVMHTFDVDASVTARYNLTGIPLQKRKLFSYQCHCREHLLSSIRHNRILRQRRQYICKHCKQPLSKNPSD